MQLLKCQTIRTIKQNLFFRLYLQHPSIPAGWPLSSLFLFACLAAAAMALSLGFSALLRPALQRRICAVSLRC
jgi:hypothetical protein